MKKILGLFLVGVLLFCPLFLFIKPVLAVTTATAAITPTVLMARGEWATITATGDTTMTDTSYVRVKYTYLSMKASWFVDDGFDVQVADFPLVSGHYPLIDDASGTYGWWPNGFNMSALSSTIAATIRGGASWGAVPGSYEYRMQIYEQPGRYTTPTTATLLATATGLLTITAGLPSMDWWALALLMMGLVGIAIPMLKQRRTRTA